MGVNKVILVGNVGKDPEIKTVGNGSKVASFPLATSESYKNQSGERVTNTEWHNVNVWRGLADIAERFVKKGTALYVEGKIKTRSYDDKDGNKRYVTNIECNEFQMLDKKGGSDDSSANNQTGAGSNQSGPGQQGGGSNVDDLPF